MTTVSQSKEQSKFSTKDKDIKSNGEHSLKETDNQKLSWSGLTEEEVVSLTLLSPDELESKLAEICSCGNYKICLKEACLLDYYVSGFWFSSRVQFTVVQVIEFFSLIKHLVENAKDHHISLVQNTIEMKNFMRCSMERSDGHAIFNKGQAQLITDYITENLFQHYKLYQFLFSTPEVDHSINERVTVEVPPRPHLPFPPPLDEAVTEDMYNEFVVSPAEQTRNTEDIQVEESKKAESPIPVKDEDVQNRNAQPSKEELLKTLKSEDVQQVVRDVSNKILNEVKNGIQKKLKERETIILPKIAKM